MKTVLLFALVASFSLVAARRIVNNTVEFNQFMNTYALDLIKQFEGLRLEPYKDGGGVWTVGYGHAILPDENFDSGITLDLAETLLINDAHAASVAVANYVYVPLNYTQHAALISFTYNVGVNAFRQSTLLRKLNSGDYVGAADEFDRWKYDNGVIVAGLVNRRTQEKQVFLA